MGSLTSRPKVPSSTTSSVVYTAPSVVSTSVATTSVEAATQAQEAIDASVAESVAQERETNLLSRNRGRLGTVLTGFRGLLSQSSDSTTRKTLLGE